MVTWEQLPKQKNSAYEWPQLLLVHSLLIPLNRVPLVASKPGRSSHLCLPQCWCRFTCSHTQFLCWGFELQVILSAQQTSLHTKPFSQPGNYYFFLSCSYEKYHDFPPDYITILCHTTVSSFYAYNLSLDPTLPWISETGSHVV